MRSGSWRPLVYFPVTLGAVVLVLGLAYLIARLFIPGFSLVGIGREGGKAVLGIAALLAYGTVLGTNRLLKHLYGREFGSYLDDTENEPLEKLQPVEERNCRRCGAPFPAYSNDAHAGGFCSRSCQEIFAKRI